MTIVFFCLTEGLTDTDKKETENNRDQFICLPKKFGYKNLKHRFIHGLIKNYFTFNAFAAFTVDELLFDTLRLIR